MMKNIYIEPKTLKKFIKNILLKANVRSDVAEHVAEGLVQTSLRGVDSHGVRLLPHYLEGVRKGRVNPNPDYKFKKTSCSTGMLNADHTFGHAACMRAAKEAVSLARRGGTGHVAVYNSTHFGAAAYYALEIAKNDMIGMSFTNTDALIRTYAGKRSFLGNNPICFAAPCEGEEPFCLDMATSVLTFNKIRQLRGEGKRVPAGAGADRQGRETRDPESVEMLLPVGGYKGYGLSMMVEIFCSLLSGGPYGPNIPKMFEAPMSVKRHIGHFISAIRIDCFQDKKSFKKRLSKMMRDLRNEPSSSKRIPVQVAGDPEKRCAEERIKSGIPLRQELANAFLDIGRDYGVGMLKELLVKNA
ncbi:MAG: Ldh family oxidoreductase [Candidatus Omnitrophica bacterium]|nr:Ldh family oxidoreductase [Candidatus Omnitrophota bacterium]